MLDAIGIVDEIDRLVFQLAVEVRFATPSIQVQPGPFTFFQTHSPGGVALPIC